MVKKTLEEGDGVGVDLARPLKGPLVDQTRTDVGPVIDIHVCLREGQVGSHDGRFMWRRERTANRALSWNI